MCVFFTKTFLLGCGGLGVYTLIQFIHKIIISLRAL